MFIETAVRGSLEIKEDDIYHFVKGIPGFEDEKAFILIEQEDSPFIYLQSTKSTDLAFLLADPFLFYPDYEFELPDSEVEELEIDKQVVVLSIMTLREKLNESTLNLLAPVVINPVKRLGKQVVLHHTVYQTRHPLWAQYMNTQTTEKVGK